MARLVAWRTVEVGAAMGYPSFTCRGGVAIQSFLTRVQSKGCASDFVLDAKQRVVDKLAELFGFAVPGSQPGLVTCQDGLRLKRTGSSLNGGSAGASPFSVGPSWVLRGLRSTVAMG